MSALVVCYFLPFSYFSSRIFTSSFLLKEDGLSSREFMSFHPAGQRVIGEPVVSGLVLDDSWLWHPDFVTAAK